MSYKILSASNATITVEVQREGGNLDPSLLTLVHGEDDFQGVINAAVLSLEDAWRSQIQHHSGKHSETKSAKLKKDEIEGALSVLLFSHLKDLPPQVLTDPGLWRYLGTWCLFDFIAWRDGEKCKLESFGAGSKTPTWACAPLRMFVRAKICAEGNAEDWESLCRVAGTDLWRSHILRVKTGNSPLVAKELVRAWQQGEVNTASVREVAKGLKRVRSNIVFEFLDDKQSRSIVGSEISKAHVALGLNM